MLCTMFLVLFAFGLRVYDLDRVPPGLQVDDERWNLEIIDQVQQGDWRLFYTKGWGREGAYYYVAATWESLFGENYLVLRLLSTFAGTLSVALVFRLARSMYGYMTGWLAAAGMSCSMWALFYSRIIFRAVLLPPALLAVLNLFWEGLHGDTEARRSRWLIWTRWLAFGLLSGALAYVYTSARILPILFALLGALSMWCLRTPERSASGWAMVAGFGVIAASMPPLISTLTRFGQGG
jgi:uncharacterized membrane protein